MKKKGRGFNEFCKVQGAMYLREYIQRKTVEWHPHIHMFALVISGLISKNFQNIGIALLGTRWLSMFAGQEKKRTRL